MDVWLFALAAISVWSLARMIVKEDGPLGVFYHFRNFVGAVEVEDEHGTHLEALEGRWLATFFVCPLCLSVWLAIPFTVFLGGGVLEWLAMSGLSRFLLRISEKE